jgi:hypothetical protein
MISVFYAKSERGHPLARHSCRTGRFGESYFSRAECGLPNAMSANEWGLRHPWLWAFFPLLLAMLFGYSGGYFLIALAIGIVMFFVTGWSWSRGWAYRHYSRRYASTNSQDDNEG